MENLDEVTKKPINEIILENTTEPTYHHDEWDDNFGDHSISSF